MQAHRQRPDGAGHSSQSHDGVANDKAIRKDTTVKNKSTRRNIETPEVQSKIRVRLRGWHKRNPDNALYGKTPMAVSPEVIRLMAAYQKETASFWKDYVNLPKYIKYGIAEEGYQVLVKRCWPAMQRWIAGVAKIRANNPQFPYNENGDN